MLNLIGSKLSPLSSRSAKPEPKTPPSADAVLENYIKKVFGKDEKNISPETFKEFLTNIQSWIVSTNEYSLQEKTAAIGDNSEKLTNLISKHNPAFAAQLESTVHKQWIEWIDKQISALSQTILDVNAEHENLKDIKITDKVLQLGLSEQGALAVSDSLSAFSKNYKLDDTSKFSESEQKIFLSYLLEQAQKASLESSGSSAEAASLAFTKTLNQGLADNASKFNKSFIETTAKEIEDKASLIGSTNIALGSKKLVSHLVPFTDAESVKENLENYGKKWQEIETQAANGKGLLSKEELREIKQETTEAINLLAKLIKTDSSYDLKTDSGRENAENFLKAFKGEDKASENLSHTDKALIEAKDTYLNLVMNKAAETGEIKSASQNLLGNEKLASLIGQGVAAIAIFAAFKALLGGNSHAANFNNPMLAGSGAGFLKKAAGLVFMATLVNNTGLLGKEEASSNIIEFPEAKAALAA